MDLLIVFAFYITLYTVNYTQNKDADEIEGQVLSCADLTVQIRHLPNHKNTEQLKIKLWNWIYL